MQTRLLTWLWFALGGVLLCFSYGAYDVALAAWLAPIFLLRFARLERWWVWLPLLFLVSVAAVAIQFRGMFILWGGADYWLLLALPALVSLLPYAADCYLGRRLGGIAGTLVFPCVATVLDYLNSFGPYGSWGATAYSQYGDLPLLQLVSVTGLWGITFLMGWCASTCNYAWDEGWGSRRVRIAAWLCAGSIAAVMFLGGLRLVVLPPAGETVRIASLSSDLSAPDRVQAAEGRMVAGKAGSDDFTVLRAWYQQVDDRLLARAAQEAGDGARIVFWADGNAPVLKPDEAALLARGSALAAQYHIYLGMALATLSVGPGKPLENKLALIRPDGSVAWQYYKSHPVPGEEAALTVTQDGKLRSLDTPFGRLSSVICYDADFTQLLAQAGALGADILLVPSNDWRAIDPWHTEMVSFRAIEQGVNLVRQTSNGLSAAYDYQGRSLAVMDHFHSRDYTMISEVPTRGVRTLYSRCGDWFAWLAAAGLLVLMLLGFRRHTVGFDAAGSGGLRS